MPARSGTSLPHQVLHTALRRCRSHTLAFCRSTQTVHPPHIYIDVWFTGVFLIEPVVLECSSSAAPWSSRRGRTHLRSADQHKLFVPRTSTSTFGSRAFSSSRPLSWNALPPQLRDPAISISIFRQSLKTHLFNNNSDWQCVIVILYIYWFSSVLSPHMLSWQFLFS